jgi:2-hydroxy-3-keto-5-methylthiopentenyl-1-phosphate phosphatase
MAGVFFWICDGMNYRVFCDFDGTVAVEDVGNEVFTSFANPDHWWKLVAEWREKKITSREMWSRQAALMRLTAHDLDRFAARQELDAHFKSFTEFCAKSKVPVCILSDGMDVYIKRILARHGLEEIPVISNRLVMHPDGTVTVEFPYFKEGCGACANCKGLHIRNLRQQDEMTIFVGDGYSDICAVKEADILFAKKDLQRYCQDNKIAFISFQTFADVQMKLEALLYY